ncbi:hypothetical protein PYW08_003310 [Mythimna loreyi]|uniref:Uncharacterized protein n=1 Tax=Mythimna loreyi TaxID=667449 RepID=A0ACC2QQT9_9NEOP|nr:hypothetical protein PYW08_003310 [Mythimna loreyi]
MKRSYDKNELSKAKNNPKATWKAIKQITNTCSQHQSPRELLQIANDPKTSINDVNNFFVNIGQTLASNITPLTGRDKVETGRSTSCNSLVILPVDVDHVKSLIESLRSDCATGYDNIPAKVLKQWSLTLAVPIAHICNRAIDSGVFPDAFKKAVVHPIFKVIVFLCASSLASAGELLQAAAPVAYSSQSFTSHVSHAPITTHEAASAYTAYAAAPIVAKSYAPSITYQSISAPVAYEKTYAASAYKTYAAAPVATYSAPVYAKSLSPAVSYSSISTHSSPVTYAAAAPIVAKTYAAPAYTTYSAPIVAKAVSPALSYSSYSTHSEPIAYEASPIITKSYAAPAIASYSVPVLKSAVTYSAAPAISYSGGEAKYGW